MKSSVILRRTSFACGRVADAMHIFVLGNNIHLMTQKSAVSHVFFFVINCKLFILHSGSFPHFHRLVISNPV
jgi:hypothetical protein